MGQDLCEDPRRVRPRWFEAQPVFFVATALADYETRVNFSPLA